jgi:hypothetical protein
MSDLRQRMKGGFDGCARRRIPVRSRLDRSLWQTEETEMEKQSSAAISPQLDFMFQWLDSRVNNCPRSCSSLFLFSRFASLLRFLSFAAVI